MANEIAIGFLYADPGNSPGAYTHINPAAQAIVNDAGAFAPLEWLRAGTPTEVAKKAPVSEAQALEVFVGTPAIDWFEHMHVLPRSLSYPNLLADTSVPMEVFSAYRRDTHTWIQLDNNAGVGVDFAGEPTLPTFIDAQQGFVFTVEISTVGDPFVDTTLDFIFTVSTILVPIEIRRIVLWRLEPEAEYQESFVFLTDVFPAESGKEKRHKLRKNPRLAYGYRYFVDDDDRTKHENLLFDYQARAFGVPTWRDDTALSVAAAASALSVTVTSTTFRDFRVGGLAVIFHPTDETKFDVLELTAITSTLLTFSSPLLNAYPIASEVFPLMPSRIDKDLAGGRYRMNLSALEIDFLPLDNDANIGSVAGFNTYNGKVFLDGGNVALQPIVRETFAQELILLDGDVGLVEQDSPWDRHKHGYRLTVRASGRQAIWQLRQLVYALAGRWTSFYAARDFNDLIAVSNLLNASTTLEVRNDGYAQFVRQRSPRNVIRVELLDGTKYMREITNSVASSPTVEALTLDGTWPSTIPFTNVRRIDFVEKLRFATDDIAIEYDLDRRIARLSAPVTAVFE